MSVALLSGTMCAMRISPVGGQNSSSNLFLGSEPHVRALV